MSELKTQTTEKWNYWTPPYEFEVFPHSTTLLRRAYEQIDAILRGRHIGWDQAMSDLRNELHEAIKRG